MNQTEKGAPQTTQSKIEKNQFVFSSSQNNLLYPDKTTNTLNIKFKIGYEIVLFRIEKETSIFLL